MKQLKFLTNIGHRKIGWIGLKQLENNLKINNRVGKSKLIPDDSLLWLKPTNHTDIFSSWNTEHMLENFFEINVWFQKILERCKCLHWERGIEISC